MDAHLLQSGMYSQLHIWLNPFLQTKIKKNNFNWSHFARSWSSTWLSQGSYASYHGLPWLYWLMLEVGLLILLWAEVFLLHPLGRQDIHILAFLHVFSQHLFSDALSLINSLQWCVRSCNQLVFWVLPSSWLSWAVSKLQQWPFSAWHAVRYAIIIIVIQKSHSIIMY